MEDPLTEHFPSRTLIDEEEEREAQQYAHLYTTPPDFEWTEGAGLERIGGVLHTDLLVIATSAAACTVLERCLQDSSQIMGSLWQPEIMRDAPVALRSLIEGPVGRASAAQVLLSSPGRTAVALCRSAIPPERAAAWAAGLLSHVRAQHILIVASLPAREYVGMEDPTQQPLQYVLESSAAARKSAHELPYLPTGNLVSGLPAAFMSCCQVQRMAATLLISVDASPVPDSPCIRGTAQALTKLLSSLGASDIASQAQRADVVDDACKSMKKAARISDRAALYI
ncbi:hypothetical protein CVIRNUC_007357 [Coccomyxa viridis]|uniref:Proteasome assembly chaperone 1 n=1 Tax=Coccomyxa viridis TaxID=1274662 RepID=A0AAV1I9W0_9CHLO|nr:hypothetical protein CVIRNUC_007357 [Coccomyxa viridis]